MDKSKMTSALRKLLELQGKISVDYDWEKEEARELNLERPISFSIVRKPSKRSKNTPKNR